MGYEFNRKLVNQKLLREEQVIALALRNFRERGEMPMNYSTGADKPAPDCGNMASRQPRPPQPCIADESLAAKKPELSICIDKQRDLQEILWSRISVLEERLSPIMRGVPPTEVAKTEKEPCTQITAILFEQCKATSLMIDKIESIVSRLEL